MRLKAHKRKDVYKGKSNLVNWRFQDLGSKEKPNYIIPSWTTIEISSYEGYPLLHSYDEKVVL